MILHLIETGGPGGAEQTLLCLAEEYKCRGIPQVVCLRKEGWLADEVRKRKLSLFIFPLGSLPDLSWLLKMRQFIKEQGITAIHSHEFAMNIRGAVLGWWLNIPVVVTVHGKNYYGDKLSRKLAYRVVSYIANMVAVSEDISYFLKNEVRVATRKLTVIENGVDTNRFYSDIKKRDVIRRKLKIQEDQLLVGTIGSYYPVKGHTYLIAAMKQVIEKEPQVKLVLAGQGPLEGELQKQINHYNLTSNVELIGYVEDTPGLLNAFDVFVMSSLSEGQPLALLEAAATEKCIIATSVGGIPEILKDQVSAVLVPPRDSLSLAEAILHIIKSPSKSQVLAHNSLLAIANRKITNVADKYLELLLARRRS